MRLDLHAPDVFDVLGEFRGQEERDAQVVVLVPNLGIDLLQNLDETVGLIAAVPKEATQDLKKRPGSSRSFSSSRFLSYR